MVQISVTVPYTQRTAAEIFSNVPIYLVQNRNGKCVPPLLSWRRFLDIPFSIEQVPLIAAGGQSHPWFQGQERPLVGG